MFEDFYGSDISDTGRIEFALFEILLKQESLFVKLIIKITLVHPFEALFRKPTR